MHERMQPERPGMLAGENPEKVILCSTAEPDSVPSMQLIQFSWLRSHRLAIGSFPHNWTTLQQCGIRKVFSCCDIEEGEWSPPAEWLSKRWPLPDHRNQMQLQPSLLASALDDLEDLARNSSVDGALYLHCLAGVERSPLLAVGLLCRLEELTLLDALAQVRHLHPQAKPIPAQLILLEDLIETERSRKKAVIKPR